MLLSTPSSWMGWTISCRPCSHCHQVQGAYPFLHQKATLIDDNANVGMTGHDVHLLKTGERFVGATGMDSHHHLSNFLISGLVQNWHGFAVASLLPQQHIMERGVLFSLVVVTWKLTISRWLMVDPFMFVGNRGFRQEWTNFPIMAVLLTPDQARLGSWHMFSWLAVIIPPLLSLKNCFLTLGMPKCIKWILASMSMVILGISLSCISSLTHVLVMGLPWVWMMSLIPSRCNNYLLTSKWVIMWRKHFFYIRIIWLATYIFLADNVSFLHDKVDFSCIVMQVFLTLLCMFFAHG